MTLSERQRRALIVLRSHGNWMSSGHFGVRTNTLDSLQKKGLVEMRTRYHSLDFEYRIIDDGRRLLASLE
ncbi:MAG: hypothetical protein K0S82_4 [Gaiellaceae bacterium]|jgi:hypothetical protein|nr:hypothetical protein [Gaiellaceae bacterium]